MLMIRFKLLRSVDVPVHLYSLYSHLNPSFSSKWAGGDEVLAYWVSSRSAVFDLNPSSSFADRFHLIRNESLYNTTSKIDLYSKQNLYHQAGTKRIKTILSHSASSRPRKLSKSLPKSSFQQQALSTSPSYRKFQESTASKGSNSIRVDGGRMWI